jgi:hypothetical protein
MKKIIIGIGIVLAMTSIASAKHSPHRHIVKTTEVQTQYTNDGRIIPSYGPRIRTDYNPHERTAVAALSSGRGELVSHPSGCPKYLFCGCGVSVKIWGVAKREFYKASAYFKFPPASPAAGMVAVRNHHVMYIMSYLGNNNALVYDPNSGGGQTRIHERSLIGYSVRNPNRA